jgi:hypothetical protein
MVIAIITTEKAINTPSSTCSLGRPRGPVLGSFGPSLEPKGRPIFFPDAISTVEMRQMIISKKSD